MTPLWTAIDLTEATGGDFATPFNATGVSIEDRTRLRSAGDTTLI